MSDVSKIAKNLRAFQIAVHSHDRENPTHTSWGIGLSGFDIDRLGLDVGEEILSGIRLEQIDVPSGVFRVLCDGDHDEHADETESVRAVSGDLAGARLAGR